MTVTKQSIDMRFGEGLDTKTDPNQIAIGKFLSLQNAVFNKAGLLQKRNGFGQLTAIPNPATATTLTTFNNNLVATGSELYAYNATTKAWNDQGLVQPVNISALSIVRNSVAQTTTDCAIAPNGSICTTYVEGSFNYFQINDAKTGQILEARTTLSGALNPRVFVLGSNFIVTYSNGNNLNYVSIPIDNPTAITNGILSTQIDSTTPAYDGAVLNFMGTQNLYIAFNGSDGGGAIRLLFMDQQLTVSLDYVIAGQAATKITVATDGAADLVWVGWTNANAHVAAWNPTLVPVLAPTQVQTGGTYNNIAGTAVNGAFYTFTELEGTLGYSPNPTSNFIYIQETVVAGFVSNALIMEGIGLGSKAFIYNNKPYIWTTYGEQYQPTYFLMNQIGDIITKLAYTNGGGYITNGVLPSVTFDGTSYYVAYLYKDLIASVNKSQAIVAGATQVNGIYSQTGVNIASFIINNAGQVSSEIANSLHLSGGELWQYDGTVPVEHGFHIWPEDIAYSTGTTGGFIGGGTANNIYFYQVTYEWTDAAGLIHRSAPSVPLKVDLSGGGFAGNTNVVVINVPTCKWTSKTNVRIVIYRYSVGQPVYYQVVPINAPLNNATRLATGIGYVAYTDTYSDAQILGNTILYTNGGVLENIGAPANISTTLFKNRLWILTAEDRNLLWFSKPILEATPVEMSNLQTVYVAPTSGGSKSTGPCTALASMDDKLIIFKTDAIYYETGTGPDITGNNNDYLDPVFITSTVGCTNLQSIVNTPMGVMFQSNKGIWILGRDLATDYIGAPVEAFNDATVVSAALIPGTNQVRFSLDSGIVLVYDYYYKHWGTFTGIPNISSTIWNETHTLLDSYGRILQETPGLYLDVGHPVLLSFKTGWINIAGLQGFERFYFFYLLGTYYTPFTLNVVVNYDYGNGPSANYNGSTVQNVIIKPDNYIGPWGAQALWGSNGPWGGPGNSFSARVFAQQQKCESFQIVINEIYDSSYGTAPGQGLSLSGMNMVVGVKKGYRTQKAGRSFG